MESVLRVVFFACLEYIASFLFLLLSSPKWRTLSYYYALVRRRASRRARFDIFKVDLKATPKESGQLAQDVEWELEKPSKVSGKTESKEKQKDTTQLANVSSRSRIARSKFDHEAALRLARTDASSETAVRPCNANCLPRFAPKCSRMTSEALLIRGLSRQSSS